MGGLGKKVRTDRLRVHAAGSGGWMLGAHCTSLSTFVYVRNVQ